MKNRTHFNVSMLVLILALLMGACRKTDATPDPFANASFRTEDQFGRPAINTVFVTGTDKDVFNLTIPSQMGTAFQAKFKTRLLALNPAYTTNALGLDAQTFTSVLATDALNVSASGKTTFFDGTNVLTGRALGDDVIDTELLLIFGGPTGTSNPGLTSDKVSANDKPFLTSFPYLATPW